MGKEAVITHLQIIHTWAEFARERDLQFFTAKHLEDIAQWSADALVLMKEQEAVEPKHNPLSPTDWFCGKCGMCISRFHDYCPSCGQAVKWE